jgi:hypothetical protein
LSKKLDYFVIKKILDNNHLLCKIVIIYLVLFIFININKIIIIIITHWKYIYVILFLIALIQRILKINYINTLILFLFLKIKKLKNLQTWFFKKIVPKLRNRGN